MKEAILSKGVETAHTAQGIPRGGLGESGHSTEKGNFGDGQLHLQVRFSAVSKW